MLHSHQVQSIALNDSIVYVSSSESSDSAGDQNKQPEQE